jgi:hypothetical protein
MQEDQKFKASLGYIVRLSQKNPKTINKKTSGYGDTYLLSQLLGRQRQENRHFEASPVKVAWRPTKSKQKD